MSKNVPWRQSGSCACVHTHVCTCVPFIKGQGKPSWGFATWFPCKLSTPKPNNG